MNTNAPTNHGGFGLNPKSFAFFVAVGIVVLVVSFAGYKAIGSNTNVQSGGTEQRASMQQQIAALQDLYYNKIGGPETDAYFGTDEINFPHPIKNDIEKVLWAGAAEEALSFCSRVYPHQTEPMDGCDFQNADGSWTYSLSHADALKQLQDDVNKYNDLASQMGNNVLDSNKLPRQLRQNGFPV